MAINGMRIAMAAPVPLREDYDAAELRRLARSSSDPGQVRRLLAVAAIYAGEARSAAAAVGGVGLQTVRDWVLRFNAEGPAGVATGKELGNQPILGERERGGARPGGQRAGGGEPSRFSESGSARRCVRSSRKARRRRSTGWCGGASSI